MFFPFHFAAAKKAARGKSSERSIFGWRGARGGSLSPANNGNAATQAAAATTTMATTLGILRDCTHPSLNEKLKSHNNVTFKLVKTGKQFFNAQE